MGLHVMRTRGPADGDDIAGEQSVARQLVPAAAPVHLQRLLGRLQRAQLPQAAHALQHRRALEHHQHAQREQRVVPAQHAPIGG